VGGGGGGYHLLRIHVKGIIDFFCDARGGAGHFFSYSLGHLCPGEYRFRLAFLVDF
jgi:hypothetical protein